jgi:hypothetical protein
VLGRWPPGGDFAVAKLVLRIDSGFSRKTRLLTRLGAIALAGSLAWTPGAASAENFFDFLFGGGPPQKQQRGKQAPDTSFFADPFGLNQPQQAAPAPRPMQSAGGSGPAFCVRSCDGRYFPLTTRSSASPAQLCQAFCPAANTKVFFGSNIDGAASGTGERYADSENAFLYRKTMKADCTCNGRDPAGLAPVDISLDTSLRQGDVIATTNGLVAYSGVRVGAGQTAEFTPVASYPGLTNEVRTRLGEMKVTPVTAETVPGDAPLVDAGREVTSSITSVPKSPAAAAPATRAKRADIE